ncbi:MAG: DUF3375 domain-containing protein [Propionibacteriaceae bacterium]|jgi:hypothetical protein|nr:DUF3375 domain-containing protein [Propionibacteriaceae bacterium]
MAQSAVATADRVMATAMRLRRALREDDPSLALLRADLMPVQVAVLSERLGGLDRQVSSTEFLAALADDLDELRGLGFELPRTAPAYFSDWIRSGVLIRRAGAGREELVELSPQAQVAVRFAAGLDARRSGVTASRLANVAELLARLARDTSPRPEERRRALLAEREALDEQIQLVEAGEFEPLGDDDALERLSEALRLALEIPGDFARVSADLESINHDLREQIINTVGSRGDVLEQIFAGVDLIDSSEAGRTFAAFYTLVLDPTRAAELDEAVSQVLSRDFSTALTNRERAFLQALLSALQRESTQVRAVMTGFSRSLRSFVQSQAFLKHRALSSAIAEARSLLLESVKGARLTTATGYELPATSFAPASVGSWRLNNPADVRTADPVRAQEIGELDLAELRRRVRLSEIDFKELRQAISSTLDERGPSTVGQVLAAHPATQGLASVVGLLDLAASVGQAGGGTEALTWRSAAGGSKTVTVPCHLFTHVPQTWATTRPNQEAVR